MSDTPAPPPSARPRIPKGLVSKVLILLAAFTAIIVAVSLFLPDRYTVERAVVIQAPPAQVHTHLADFEQWAGWLRWTRQDEAATFAHHGEPGPGQTLTWDGPDLGKGRIEMLALSPERVEIALEFRRGGPRPTGVLVLQPADGGATRVVWRIEGKTPFQPLGNYLALFTNSTIGPDLDAGLAGLKRAVDGAK